MYYKATLLFLPNWLPVALSVPVLAKASFGGQGGQDPQFRPLPPVPPRLRGEGLQAWLQRHAG
jgi:hypothetical protein